MNHKPPTVFLLGKDHRGWSIDQDYNNTRLLLIKSGYTITHNIFVASHIWCVWFDLLMLTRYRWVLLLRAMLHKKIIGVITNDVTKNPEKIPFIKKQIDVCVAPSEEVERYLQQHHIPTIRIPFYVRPDLFFKIDHAKEKIAHEIGINFDSLHGKIIIGSFQRDSLSSNLTEQKWQKNPELIIEILKQLPKERFILLLAGPRRHYIVRRCVEEKIPYLYVGDASFMECGQDDYPHNILSAQKMNLLYNLCDLYLVSSKSEGGPKAILETGLTQTLVFSTKVGIAPDFLDPELLFDVDDSKTGARLIRSYFENPLQYLELSRKHSRRVHEVLDVNEIKKRFQQIFEV